MDNVEHYIVYGAIFPCDRTNDDILDRMEDLEGELYGAAVQRVGEVRLIRSMNEDIVLGLVLGIRCNWEYLDVIKIPEVTDEQKAAIRNIALQLDWEISDMDMELYLVSCIC